MQFGNLGKNASKYKLAVFFISVILFTSTGVSISTAPEADLQLSQANVDIFVDLGPNIDGDAKRTTHVDWIEAYSYTWGVITDHSPTGFQSGRGPQITDIFITKGSDRSSAKIVQYCFENTLIPEAKIEVVRGGETPIIFIKYLLRNVYISSFLQEVVDGGGVTETFSLFWEEMTYTYTPQNPDGTSAADITYMYDRDPD